MLLKINFLLQYGNRAQKQSEQQGLYFFSRVFAQQDYVIPTGKIQKLNINSTRKMAAKHAAKFFSLVTVVPCGREGDSGGFSTAPSVAQLRLPQGDVLEDCGKIQMILANRQKKGGGQRRM